MRHHADAPGPFDSRAAIGATLLAGLAALARWPNGTPMAPAWCLAALQLPALLTWLRWLASPQRDVRTDRILTLLVALGAATIVITRKNWQFALVATTAYVNGMLLLTLLSRLYRTATALLNRPADLLRALARPWLTLALIATFVLALPIATRSGVPDYRHNFWLHVSNAAFDAVSAACLVGVTIHGIADDYTPVGRTCLWLTTQLAGALFATVSFSIIRPLLRNRFRLRTILLWCLGLQVVAVLTLWPSWTADHAPDRISRLGLSALYAADALWNTGLLASSTGLSTYLLDGRVYGVISALALVGSLGLPLVLDVLRGPTRRPVTSSKVEATSDNLPAPLVSLPNWESAAAFLLLLGGALAIAAFETPGVLPDRFVPPRPLQFDDRQIALRDDMSIGMRASLAVFVSATLRSAGIQSIPLEAGAISHPTFILMLVWMVLGGCVAGVAGGMRVTALLLPLRCLASPAGSWRHLPDGPARRRRLTLRPLGFALLWILFNAACVCLLSVVTDGTPREYLFEVVAAANGVGLSTGLSLHLTGLGRVVMILIMIAGCFGPMIFWTRLAADWSPPPAPVPDPTAPR